MSRLRTALEQRLLSGYSAYYDITPFPEGSPLVAQCAYHSRDEQYVLVRKAKLWGIENHEYLYLYSVPILDETLLEQIFQQTLADGEPRVRPHAEHMSTFLTAVIVCEQAQKEALQKLRSLKKHRDYKLSLHGWMEFRIAAVDLSTGEIVANRSGKPLIQGLTQQLARVTSIIGEEKNQ